MKTALLAVVILLLLSSCKEDASPIDVVLRDSATADITVELVSTEPYQGVDNYFIAVYCVSNNSNKTFDSVKVTFTNVTTQRTHRFLNMKPTEKYYPAVSYSFNNTSVNPIKTTLEWW